MPQPILKPAYGRIDHTFHDSETAYARGLDFIYTNPTAVCGTYCSCRDFIGMRVTLIFGDRNQFQADTMVHVVEPDEYRGADYGDDSED